MNFSIKQWQFGAIFLLTALATLDAKATDKGNDNYQGQIEKIFTETDDSAVKSLWDGCKNELEKDMASFETCMANEYTELSTKHPEIAAQILKTGIVEKIKKISTSNESTTAQTTAEERWQEVAPEMPEQPLDDDLKKLGEYYGKKMDKIIYGDEQSLKTKLSTQVRPELYHKIHLSQISKNIIETISSYCVEADANNLYLIPKDDKEREKVKTTNIQNTSKFANDQKSNKKINLAAHQWTQCADSIHKICYQKDNYASLNTEPSQTDSSEQKRQKEYYQFSWPRACQAISYIKKQRETIILTESDLKEFEKHDKDFNGSSDFLSVVNFAAKDNPNSFYLGNEANKTVDDITSMASGELLDESKFQASNDQIIDELEKCLKNVNEPFCKKYFSADLQKETKQKIEQLKNAAVEYALKAKMKEEEVDKLKDNESRLEDFLVSEGRERKKAKEIIKQNTPAKVAATIKDEIKNERQSIFSIFKQKLSELLAIDQSQRPQQTATEQMKKKKELTVEEQAQLMHYNNIVSGYLKLTQENQADMMNIKALSRELANSFYDEKRNQKFQQQQIVETGHLEKIKEGAQADLAQQADTKNDQIELTVENINQLLGREYDEKQPKDQAGAEQNKGTKNGGAAGGN